MVGEKKAKWERQDGEPQAAYRAFLAFRDLGSTRSLGATAEAISREYYTVANYSRTFDWFKRGQAWDDHVKSVEDQAVLSEAAKLAVEHLRASKLERTVAVTSMMRILQQAGDDPPVDGRTAATMLKDAIHAERLVIGEATSREEQRQSVDLSKLTGDEAERLLSLMGKLGIEEL